MTPVFNAAIRLQGLFPHNFFCHRPSARRRERQAYWRRYQLCTTTPVEGFLLGYYYSIVLKKNGRLKDRITVRSAAFI